MAKWPDFDVPADWRMVPIGELASILRSGGTPSRKNESYWNGEIPFVLIEDMTSAGLYLNATKEHITKAGFESSSAWLVPPGSVLLSMYATIGTTTINQIPVATNQAILAIIPKSEISSEFLALCLQAHKVALSARNVQATQKNVGKGIVEKFTLPIPPLHERRDIVHVLLVVQRTIEVQDRIIATTIELKRTLIKKVFTEGLRGKPLKDTEIGLIPEGWTLTTLGSLMATQPQNGLYKPKASYGEGVQILRIDDFSNDGDVVSSSPERLAATENEILTYSLKPNDIVLNRVNSLSHLGKTALVGELIGPLLFESNMMRFSVDPEKCLPEYAFQFLNSPVCKAQILSMAKRAVAQASVSQGDVEALKIPLPPLDLQAEIRDAVLNLSLKVAICREKRSLLESLFCTLLHELMTAKIRVGDLDLSVLKVPEVA